MIHNNFLPGRKVLPRAKLLCFAVAGVVKLSCRLWELFFLLNPITEWGGEQGVPCSSRAGGTAAVLQPRQGSRSSHTGLSWVCSTSHRGTRCTQAPCLLYGIASGPAGDSCTSPSRIGPISGEFHHVGVGLCNGVGNTPHCFYINCCCCDLIRKNLQG